MTHRCVKAVGCGDANREVGGGGLVLGAALVIAKHLVTVIDSSAVNCDLDARVALALRVRALINHNADTCDGRCAAKGEGGREGRGPAGPEADIIAAAVDGCPYIVHRATITVVGAVVCSPRRRGDSCLPRSLLPECCHHQSQSANELCKHSGRSFAKSNKTCLRLILAH